MYNNSKNINDTAYSTYELIKDLPFSHHGGYCCKCKSELRSVNIKENLYAIRCNYCETLTLVKAPDPYTAEISVGIGELIHASGYNIR